MVVQVAWRIQTPSSKREIITLNTIERRDEEMTGIISDLIVAIEEVFEQRKISRRIIFDDLERTLPAPESTMLPEIPDSALKGE